MGNGFCRFWHWGEFFMKRKKKRIRTRWNIKVFVIYAVTLFFIIFGVKTAVVKIAELIQGRVEAQSQEETDVTAEEETEKTQTFRERHRLQLICSISMNIQDPGLHLKKSMEL